MTKAIFFDFDGVIMDSMDLKLDSYCQALAPFGFPTGEIDRIMRDNMGTSRHKILVAMYQELSGKPITDEIFKTALTLFNELDEASRARMKPMPGSLEFLGKIHRHYFTAVVTGTPEDVVRRTTAFHKLNPYFDIVRGSPDTKTVILTALMADNGLAPDDCLMIGDGRADQEAADNCRIRFAGMNCHGASFDPATAWRVIRDLNELLPIG